MPILVWLFYLYIDEGNLIFFQLKSTPCMFPRTHSMLSVYRYIDVHVRKTHVCLTFDKRSKTILKKIGTTKSQELIFANLFCTSSSKTQRNYEKKINFFLQSHQWPETVHHRLKASSRLVLPMLADPRLRSTPMPICGRFVTLLAVIYTRSKLITG